MANPLVERNHPNIAPTANGKARAINKINVVLIMLGLAKTLVSVVSALNGTATYYTPPYVPSSCYGYQDQGVMIAAASDAIWDNRAGCGRRYRVRCTGATNDGVSKPCRGNGVTVRIVDYCPTGCRGTIDLSQEAFAMIANPNAGNILIDYTNVDGKNINLSPPPPPPRNGRNMSPPPPRSRQNLSPPPPRSVPIHPEKVNPPPPKSQPAGSNGIPPEIVPFISTPPLNQPAGSNRTSPYLFPVVSTAGGGHSSTTRIIAAYIVGVVLLAGCTTAACFVRRKKAKKQRAIVAELQANQGPVSYEYSVIKRMTDSKQDKLGEGGFGAVYRGKLPGDGRLVAVKLLNEAKGSGMDFVNEVRCISRTSHNNCIKLLGYCLKKGKRALIYEFMPKGSLEKFIHVENQSEAYSRLGWEMRFRIAVGIAKGLNYLHEDLKPAILHLDIKPHNILLDDDFTPKLSDFGLAKLFSGDSSSTWTEQAQGTIGYIAPEVRYGNLSTKADVYSYGMLLLELVGGRRNFDAGVADSSKEIFSYWIQKRVHSKEDLELYGINGPNEEEIARKMTLVGMNCVQEVYVARPPMRVVLEMLNKRSEDIPLPPNPFSPPPIVMRTGSSSSNPSTTQSISFNPSMARALSSDGRTNQGVSATTPTTQERPSNA